ncbi:MAG: ATPase V [Bacteroidales bacterium]|nr:ATPase V [Bacteroidales bacterium]
MINKMTKYSFILLDSDKENFLKEIQELGIVDITRSTKPVDSESLSMLAEIEDIRKETDSIRKGEDERLRHMRAHLSELKKSEIAALPWGEYNIAGMKKLHELGLPIHRYCTAAKKYDEEWEDNWAIGAKQEMDGMVYFVIVGNADGFPLKEMTLPEKPLQEIRQEIRKMEEGIEEYQLILASRKAELGKMSEEMKVRTAELNRHIAELGADRAADNTLAVFEGFAPSESDGRMEEALEKLDALYISSPATIEDKPPIQLKNNRFTKQFEVLTSMYGMPVYNEFDPTIFLSIFFLLFFAMCMGDAGYGLLLIAIGMMLRGKDSGLGKLWSLIVTLGAGTFIIGIIMGGFFGMDLSEQNWVPEGLKKIMITGDISIGGGTYAKQMILSLGIGILHICLALIMKAVWAVKNNGIKNSLGTLGWTLLIVGGIITLAVGMLGVVSEEAMKLTLIVIAIVSAIGIYFLNKWGRNPLLNFGAGLWDTYNTASGLMGDVLSYIRLYALGLSGGMLGSTFNQIAEMVKGTDPTWQWIPFVIILLIGHALNLAMSCLGAFVHPLRLNFVEFFKNSDYQGKGKTYNPLK